jgi:hypothetical protein
VILVVFAIEKCQAINFYVLRTPNYAEKAKKMALCLAKLRIARNIHNFFPLIFQAEFWPKITLEKNSECYGQ